MTYINYCSLVFGFMFLTACTGSTDAVVADEHNEEHNESMIELTDGQYKNAEIQTGKIEQRILSNGLRVSGLVDAPPQNMISISAPLGGYVVSTDLIDGMKVKKGQKLITLEHQDYIQMQQDYLDKRSQLDYLENEYTRQQKLHDEKVNSDKVYQQTVAQYKSMKAQVTGLKEKLAFIGINANKLDENAISRRVTIYAPSNGYISKVNTNIGKYCNPTDVLIEIVNTDHLHAELTVYEKDLGKIAIGQSVRIIIPGNTADEVRATIYLIGKAIGKDRSVKVHAHFEKENENMVPGMYLNASIETKTNKVHAVPDEAVVSFAGKSFIVLSEGTKVEEGTKKHYFKLLEVETGVSEFGYTEISSNETLDFSSLTVVLNGAYHILAKLKNSEDEGHDH